MGKTRLYSNENLPRRVVEALLGLGYDVLTSLAAGRANLRIPDDDVLSFASGEARAVLTLNRRDFIKLHRATGRRHGGIVVCTRELDVSVFADRIDRAIRQSGALAGQLVRVNLPVK